MSYCRFSCMGFRCDIYCYEAVDGFKVHVAANRRPEGCPGYDFSGPPDKVLASYKVRQDWLDDPANESIPIGLPYDGKYYSLSTAAECAAKLRELRAVGYLLPDYALAELDEEARTLVPPTSPAA